MTSEAERAKELASHFEAWKWRITEQTGGKYRIPFDVKSEDLPESVKNAPVGTRFMVALVELADDETAKEPEVKPKSFAGQAKLLAQDEAFGRYIVRDTNAPPMNASANEGWIEGYCDVVSCSHLTEGSPAGKRFKQLQSEYLNWKRFGE